MKRIIIFFLSLLFITAGYHLYYPTRVIGIHHTSEHIIVIVVEHFPWTKKGKIRWWERHRNDIFNQVNFKENVYSIYIYNTHYKKDSGTDQDSDLRCFEEMNTAANCISKENRPLIIRHYRDGHTEYTTESIFRRFY
ncbi:DUF943 family protein [Pantoea sp. FN0302]|uniref:DUF943 family protein n=1 Tax=Pantoea sp. FN0302 TaxID=3418558 RepID=UPI003CEA6ACB